LLNLFAPQAAVAIENARLYTAAQRQKQYFEELVQNSPVAVVTSTTSTTSSPATRLRGTLRLPAARRHRPQASTS